MSRINVEGIGYVEITQAELKNLDAEVSRRNEKGSKDAPRVTRESVLAERFGASKSKKADSAKPADAAAKGSGAKSSG